MVSTEIIDLVIEDLMDSDFRPDDHEAHAYITERYSKLTGRIGSKFLSLLNEIDWDFVEEEVKRLKSELRDQSSESVLDDIDFHINQLYLSLSSHELRLEDFNHNGIYHGAKLVAMIGDMRMHAAGLRKYCNGKRENRDGEKVEKTA